MFKPFFRHGAIGAVLIAAIYPHTSFGKQFTSAEFLEWPRESQKGYFQSAIGMAGFIALENDQTHGKCLENWYLKNAVQTENLILETMRKNRAYHPRAILVALMQKACGPFDYSKR